MVSFRVSPNPNNSLCRVGHAGSEGFLVSASVVGSVIVVGISGIVGRATSVGG